MIQKIVVKNKSQLMAAFECARECPVDTEIRMLKSKTVFYILAQPMPITPTIDPPKHEEYSRFDSQWKEYGRNRKYNQKHISKLKGKLRKTDAKAIY